MIHKFYDGKKTGVYFYIYFVASAPTENSFPCSVREIKHFSTIKKFLKENHIYLEKEEEERIKEAFTQKDILPIWLGSIEGRGWEWNKGKAKWVPLVNSVLSWIHEFESKKMVGGAVLLAALVESKFLS